MHKEQAKKMRKLGSLRNTVNCIKKTIKTINDPIELYHFLDTIKNECMQAGASNDEANWIIVYATELEEL